MRTIIISVLFFLSVSVSAQVPLNRTVYDCNGNTKNIYSILASGKAIIIAHNGVDCSICQNAAPGWQSWAANNDDKVEVWCALTYTYNPNQFSPSNMCTKTTQWVTQYGWNDIFTFPDSNRLWVNGPGSPQYYVYSAKDSSIVYQGSNSTTARNTALAQSTVGIQEVEQGAFFSFRITDNSLFISGKNKLLKQVQLFTIDGKLLVSKMENSTNINIEISNLPRGTYVVSVETANGKTGSKKFVL